jgi:hypothetical protein
MEDSRQNLRTEFRAAAESSGLAGFGLASAVEEDGEMKTLEGGHKNEEGGAGRASVAFPMGLRIAGA